MCKRSYRSGWCAPTMHAVSGHHGQPLDMLGELSPEACRAQLFCLAHQIISLVPERFTLRQ